MMAEAGSSVPAGSMEVSMAEYKAGVLVTGEQHVGYFIMGTASCYTFTSKDEFDGVISMLVAHGARVSVGHLVDVSEAPEVHVQ